MPMISDTVEIPSINGGEDVKESPSLPLISSASLRELESQRDSGMSEQEILNLAFPPEWAMDMRAHQAQLQEFQDHPPATREPIYIYFKYNEFTYTTRAYANSVFSEAEWQSPERTQRIEYLKRAAVKLADPGLEVLKQEARVRNLPPEE